MNMNEYEWMIESNELMHEKWVRWSYFIFIFKYSTFIIILPKYSEHHVYLSIIYPMYVYSFIPFFVVVCSGNDSRPILPSITNCNIIYTNHWTYSLVSNLCYTNLLIFTIIICGTFLMPFSKFTLNFVARLLIHSALRCALFILYIYVNNKSMW